MLCKQPIRNGYWGVYDRISRRIVDNHSMRNFPELPYIRLQIGGKSGIFYKALYTACRYYDKHFVNSSLDHQQLR